MDDRTPDQLAADNTLDNAILAAAHTWGVVSPGELITQWAVVLTATQPDEGRTTYGLLFPGGTMPSYMAVGLFRCAERLIVDQPDD